MLRILAIASVLTAVCATNYAYVGNNLIEFEDSPAQTISLPLPYQEPKTSNKEEQEISKERDYADEANYAYDNAISSQQYAEGGSLFSVGTICSKITKIINFIKNKIQTIITAIPTFIINMKISVIKCILTSLCSYFDIARIPSLSDMSSLLTPARLKRATQYLQTAIKEIDSL